MQPVLTRRDALTGAAGLVIGAYVAPRAALAKGPMPDAPVLPNAFLRIAPDNIVTVIVKHLEFGQGPITGLTTLVAEELGADWSQMRAEHAPANAKLYNNLSFGPMQGTGGSSAIANSYMQMRRVGAAAREMLIAAAAAEWRAPASEITLEKGVLRHGDKNAPIGAFAEQAATLMDVRRRAGRPGETRDTMIAGIALAQRATLATRNIRHFDDLAVPVVNPWRA